VAIDLVQLAAPVHPAMLMVFPDKVGSAVNILFNSVAFRFKLVSKIALLGAEKLELAQSISIEVNALLTAGVAPLI
jgi:hypothetical protein